MERALRLTDFVLLACEFEIIGAAAERAAEMTGDQADHGDKDAASRGPGESGDERGDAPTDSEEEAETEIEDAGPPRFILDLEGARLEYVAEEEGDEFVLVVQTWVTDAAAPFELYVITGARFDVPEPRVSADDAAGTLLFVTYPYIREVISSISGRSPYESFSLPPLTKLPHPSLFGPNPSK